MLSRDNYCGITLHSHKKLFIKILNDKTAIVELHKTLKVGKKTKIYVISSISNQLNDKLF